RALERRVIVRRLDHGPQVLATGGGAFINPDTRSPIRRNGISLWLNADLDVLLRRGKRRSDRPLLKTSDPGETLRRLMEERYPVYAEADIIVHSRDVPHDKIVEEIMTSLSGHLGLTAHGPAPQSEQAPGAPVRLSEPTTVRVALAERSYDIVIGRN